MDKIIISLILLISVVSCGDNVTTSVSTIDQSEILGTWSLYKMTLDSGTGESLLGPSIDNPDSIDVTFRFTVDSLYRFTASTNSIKESKYKYEDNAIIYDNPSYENQMIIFGVAFNNDDLVLSSSSKESKIIIYMYFRRLE